MYFRLMGKLNARRNGLLAEDEKGFTLIELLVVVIIIGILAAIAIPVYLGVQKNAKDSAVKTDVTNLKTAVVSVETELGALPDVSSWTGSISGTPSATINSTATPSSGTWSDAGATFSQYEDSAATFVYKLGTGTTPPYAFCIQATSKTGNVFHATDSDGVAKGACS